MVPGPSVSGMTNDLTDEKMTALQGVVERVASYQEAAPEGTVDKELREALQSTDLELSDEQVRTLVEAIEARDKTTDTVDVREVLG